MLHCSAHFWKCILFLHLFTYITFRAVVCRLFRKPVNLLQRTVGYRLTYVIQSSDLYFLLINTCHSAWIRPPMCVHVMFMLYIMKQIPSFTILRNVALSYSELVMILNKSRDFYVLGHISIFFCFTMSQNGYEIVNNFD